MHPATLRIDPTTVPPPHQATGERRYAAMFALAAGLALASTPLGLVGTTGRAAAEARPPLAAPDHLAGAVAPAPPERPADSAFDRIDWRDLFIARVLEPARTSFAHARERYAIASATAAALADATDAARSLLLPPPPRPLASENLRSAPHAAPGWFTSPQQLAAGPRHAAAPVQDVPPPLEPAAAWLAPEPPGRTPRFRSTPADVLR